MKPTDTRTLEARRIKALARTYLEDEALPGGGSPSLAEALGGDIEHLRRRTPARLEVKGFTWQRYAYRLSKDRQRIERDPTAQPVAEPEYTPDPRTLRTVMQGATNEDAALALVAQVGFLTVPANAAYEPVADCLAVIGDLAAVTGPQGFTGTRGVLKERALDFNQRARLLLFRGVFDVKASPLALVFRPVNLAAWCWYQITNAAARVEEMRMCANLKCKHGPYSTRATWPVVDGNSRRRHFCKTTCRVHADQNPEDDARQNAPESRNSTKGARRARKHRR